ncbi:MAG: hypothetical protein KKG00_07570 [Bacteroidetes bacterium]|nr:hypothetical protein [Bacteroidota bacterium]
MSKITLIVTLLLCISSLAMAADHQVAERMVRAEPGDFVGTYKVSGDLPFNKIIVSEKEGKLHYVAGEYTGFFSAVADKADTYLSQDGGGTVMFVRNGAGKVTKLKLEVQGSVFEAEKEAVATLTDYVGSYKLSGDLPISKIIVSEKSGKLHYVAGEYEGDFSTVSGKADTYLSQDGGGTVVFKRDGDGKVTKLTLEVQGGLYEAPKEMTSMLTDYVGTYLVEGLPFDKVILTVQDNQLHIVAGDNEGNLTPMGNQADTFDAGGKAVIRFKRDDASKVQKMLLEAQGYTFEGTPAKK